MSVQLHNKYSVIIIIFIKDSITNYAQNTPPLCTSRTHTKKTQSERDFTSDTKPKFE